MKRASKSVSHAGRVKVVTIRVSNGKSHVAGKAVIKTK